MHIRKWLRHFLSLFATLRRLCPARSPKPSTPSHICITGIAFNLCNRPLRHNARSPSIRFKNVVSVKHGWVTCFLYFLDLSLRIIWSAFRTSKPWNIANLCQHSLCVKRYLIVAFNLQTQQLILRIPRLHILVLTSYDHCVPNSSGRALTNCSSAMVLIYLLKSIRFSINHLKDQIVPLWEYLNDGILHGVCLGESLSSRSDVLHVGA